MIPRHVMELMTSSRGTHHVGGTERVGCNRNRLSVF